ncbi:hypothetical protein PCAR4_140001 [Paraburkholderia caribensis]|nr:hypothetical protein PCAR4_140001 [Paraburkholderia caribensis]
MLARSCIASWHPARDALSAAMQSQISRVEMRLTAMREAVTGAARVDVMALQYCHEFSPGQR